MFYYERQSNQETGLLQLFSVIFLLVGIIKGAFFRRMKKLLD